MKVSKNMLRTTEAFYDRCLCHRKNIKNVLSIFFDFKLKTVSNQTSIGKAIQEIKLLI